MSDLDRETLSQVLQVARDHGYRHVKLRSGQNKFEAELPESDLHAEDGSGSEPTVDAETGPRASEGNLTAPVVGYYRRPDPPLAIGAAIVAGQVVGEVVALGIANEIVSGLAGEVTEVLVEDGAALEYGQVLAKVKLS